jgi:cation/acetate symporter
MTNVHLGEPTTTSIFLFFFFIAITLGITYWAARKTKTTEEFFAADRSITGVQNGFALAGDYMSAASFLGIAGMVATSGFDGLIYSIGFLVGWPIVLFLIAEPLRSIGKYTFSDVVSYRLKQKPVRIAAAIGTIAVVLLYLIAQMVGAGSLIKLIFGLSYENSVVIVGCIMLIYVLFGGMIATTWVQIIKAVLLLGGAFVMAILVLLQFDFNPLSLFAAAAEKYGDAVLAPGKLVSNPLDAVSLGIALMIGTAGLPHILMRFYTVPDTKQARKSVFVATGLIGFFYLLTFVIGFGAMVLVGTDVIKANGGTNMSALLLADAVGGNGFFGFISAVAFATILAVVAGLTLSGASALSHDLWVNVVRDGSAPQKEQMLVARIATIILGIAAIAFGLLFQKENVAFMVGLAFAVAASSNFPALVMSIFWKGFTTKGAVVSMLTGTISSLVLIYLSPTIQIDVLKNTADAVLFPLKNPALVSLPLAFLAGIVVSILMPDRQEQHKFAEMSTRIYQGNLGTAGDD